MTKQISNTKRITTSAILIATALVLDFISRIIPGMPQGGSITLASLVPILVISYCYGWKWGVFSALVFGILKAILSRNFAWMPEPTFWSFTTVALLDYIVAFGVIGLADLFRKPFKNESFGYAFSCVVVMFLRFLCHFASGIIIWYPFAEAAGFDNRWLFSAIYNGSYMLPEAIISSVVVVILMRYVKKGFNENERR